MLDKVVGAESVDLGATGGFLCIGAGARSVSVEAMSAIRVGSVSVGTVRVETVRFELSMMSILKLRSLSVLEQWVPSCWN